MTNQISKARECLETFIKLHTAIDDRNSPNFVKRAISKEAFEAKDALQTIVALLTTLSTVDAGRLESALDNSRFSTGRLGGTQEEALQIYEAARTPKPAEGVEYGHNHCKNCGGNGYIQNTGTEQCPKCKGLGLTPASGHAPIADLDGLKREIYATVKSADPSIHHGICIAIDHLASRRLIGGGWIDIETAPKDGNQFLVCLPRQGNLILRARFCKVHKYFTTDRMSEGITQLAYFHEGDLWMPMPAAPDDGGSQ